MISSRIWDPFLTDQDHKSLRVRPHVVRGFRDKPAVILVDLYRGVFGDSPQPLLDAIEEWPGSCGLVAWDAIPYIQRLVSVARSCSIPVIHITGLDAEGLEGWSEQGRRSAPSSLAQQQLERVSRRFDIVSELGPIQGETVFRKTSPSAFWGTPLVAHLNALRVDTVIVAGESTSGCVRATVVDARTYRYNVIVAEECVFDRHQASHAINLFDMHQKYADVLLLDEVIQEMTAFKERSLFIAPSPVSRGL